MRLERQCRVNIHEDNSYEKDDEILVEVRRLRRRLGNVQGLRHTPDVRDMIRFVKLKKTPGRDKTQVEYLRG